MNIKKNKRNHHYQIVSQCLLKRFTFPHWYSKKKHVCARTRGQGVSGQENSSMMFFTKFLAFKTVFQLPLFQTQYVHHVTLIPPFSNHVWHHFVQVVLSFTKIQVIFVMNYMPPFGKNGEESWCIFFTYPTKNRGKQVHIIWKHHLY